MAEWHPTPDNLYPFFLLLGGWGIADGIWMSQMNSMIGSLFPKQFEEAFAAMRIAQGVGLTVVCAYSQSFCMASKIYIMCASCLASLALYLLSEILLRREPVEAKTVHSIDVC